MAGTINITLEEVTNHAGQIRSSNAEMTTTLQQAQDTMKQLGSTWQGTAATDLEAKVGALSAKFTQYNEVIESYAKFLDNAVEIYKQTEQQIDSGAQGLA